jgi:hypothetical protein
LPLSVSEADPFEPERNDWYASVVKRLAQRADSR